MYLSCVPNTKKQLDKQEKGEETLNILFLINTVKGQVHVGITYFLLKMIEMNCGNKFLIELQSFFFWQSE